MRSCRLRPLTSTQTLLSCVLIPCLLLAACASEEEKARSELEAQVMATFENTPEHLREEVLRTCDKWHRVDRGRECVEVEARKDQFECWLAKGYPKLEHGYEHRLRQRTRDHTTLMKQDHCMELRRWKLIHGRAKQYEHIFGTDAASRQPDS